uniref:uncharacterized protein LOC129517657 n=1 Tax=Nyctereutes procyonoides TaxID=34880 RepID=UPI002444FF76|nr:uncharacterized protein LOC129517657 [Nyctereutes procyonoides]
MLLRMADVLDLRSLPSRQMAVPRVQMASIGQLCHQGPRFSEPWLQSHHLVPRTPHAVSRTPRVINTSPPMALTSPIAMGSLSFATPTASRAKTGTTDFQETPGSEPRVNVMKRRLVDQPVEELTSHGCPLLCIVTTAPSHLVPHPSSGRRLPGNVPQPRHPTCSGQSSPGSGGFTVSFGVCGHFEKPGGVCSHTTMRRRHA